METTTAHLIPLTLRAIERLYTAWLEPHVRGLSIEAAERRAYASHLALTLHGDMPCPCNRALCANQHTLAAWADSEKTLESFVYRAVIGPVGLKTQSIAQGMLFPYLRHEYGLQVGLVAYKHCANPTCHKLYEGATCPYCRTPFHPQTTPVLGIERIVMAGELGYFPLRYWRCSGSQPAHFYALAHCHDGGKHGSVHDRCPWQDCPGRNPAHGQRSTALWVRAKFLRPTRLPERQPQFLAAVAAGVQQALKQCSGWERAMLELLGDHDLAIAEHLLTEEKIVLTGNMLQRAMAAHPEAPTLQTLRRHGTRDLRAKVLQAVRQACLQRGIDLPGVAVSRQVA